MPWRTWLQESHLIKPVNGICLVILGKDFHNAWRTLELGTKLIKLARQIYPEAHGVIPVSGDLYSFLLAAEDKIEFSSIKPIAKE